MALGNISQCIAADYAVCTCFRDNWCSRGFNDYRRCSRLYFSADRQFLPRPDVAAGQFVQLLDGADAGAVDPGNMR